MKKKNDTILLAPVGSFESLRAAVAGTADAVYFGVEQLNMRARSANNFTVEDMAEIAAICRENSMRSYLTVNTILYNHDLALMKKIVQSAKDSGVDAVIAMDHAVIMFANEINMPVHISTQANITNIESVKFYAHFADVVVMSRELTLMQLKKISEQIKKENITGPSGHLIKVEAFIHGALCMAVSGKCYLSLHTHNSSANRGACKQNCRRTYTVKDEEGNELEIDNEFIMSPKDLCTIGFLDKILDAGVSVLKIEGRSKGPEYVKEVCLCYREAIDAINDGTYNSEKIKAWEERMENVYNRGFWGGYYLGKKLGEWTDAPGSKAKKRKSYIGDGIKYFGNIGVGEFKLKSGKLSVGDDIYITGPTTGILEIKVENLRLDGKDVKEVRAGDHFSMPIKEKIRNSDKLYKIETMNEN
jgi:putative protease